MKRIFVEKKEQIAELIERIIDEPGEELVFVIPKNAILGNSTSNFHLLRREAESSGKRIRIESVDEGVLAMARSSKIEAFHPLLDDVRQGSFSDIISFSNKARQDNVVSESKSVEKSPARNSPKMNDDGLEETPRRLDLNYKLVVGCIVLVALIWGTSFAVNKLFSRATVRITFKKADWAYAHAFVADVSVSKASADKSILPAELFTLERNVTQLFAASGKSNVSVKASGKINIYNNYSSKSQLLVATTRFETLDGKVFRITDQVLVPGAEIKDGKIIPSKVSASVVAEKAGPEYNVGPVPKLTIPGFRGTPRYDGFYGEIVEPFKGGFIGERAVPTKDDIAQAKTKTTEILKTSLQNNFMAAYPADFKILDDASEVGITKLNVNESTDQNGKFSVFGEASMRAIGFREQDLKSLLLILAQSNNPEMVFKSLKLEYKTATSDFKNKKVGFGVSAAGELWHGFDEGRFASSILGKKIGDVRSLVSSLEGLSTAKISVWPIWLSTIPMDANRVNVSID